MQPEKDVSALAPRICIFIQSLQTDTRTYVCVAVETVGTENRQHGGLYIIIIVSRVDFVFFSFLRFALDAIHLGFVQIDSLPFSPTSLFFRYSLSFALFSLAPLFHHAIVRYVRTCTFVHTNYFECA